MRRFVGWLWRALQPCQLHVIDDRAASIVYPTVWAPPADMAAYGGTLHTTSSANATASMMFTGRSIAVVAPVGPNFGSVQTCLDPGVTVTPCTTVTLQSATPVEREVVYVSGPLTAGQHTIDVIRQSGSVALDGFAVLG
jgi:hypothetical protein